jgi:hypothetical protein
MPWAKLIASCETVMFLCVTFKWFSAIVKRAMGNPADVKMRCALVNTRHEWGPEGNLPSVERYRILFSAHNGNWNPHTTDILQILNVFSIRLSDQSLT